MARTIHLLFNRRGSASRHKVIMDLQQRTAQHSHWRDHTRNETETGRVKSSYRPTEKWDDYRICEGQRWPKHRLGRPLPGDLRVASLLPVSSVICSAAEGLTLYRSSVFSSC